MDLETYEQFGLHQNFGDVHGAVAVNGRRNIEIVKALDTPGDATYTPCVEATAELTPTSSISYFPDWRSSVVYPDTVRDLWIVCPVTNGCAGDLLDPQEMTARVQIQEHVLVGSFDLCGAAGISRSGVHV